MTPIPRMWFPLVCCAMVCAAGRRTARRARDSARARANACYGNGSGIGARDHGMSTAEYAVGTLAAVAFAGVLYAVVSSEKTRNLISSVVEHALSVPM